MPTIWLLLRHGKTDNPEQRCYGWRDVPLHPDGQAQMQQCAAKLQAVRLAAIATSDLVRARDSARYFALPRSLDVQVFAALREIDFGQIEGLTFRDVEEHYPVTAREWVAAPAAVRFPGGECFADVRARVIPWARNWLRDWEQQTTLLVIHSGTMRALLQWMTGCEPHATLMVKIGYGDILRCTQEHLDAPWQLEAMPYGATAFTSVALE
ncbi:MAG: histidine phosphatase family protein [Chloracidobacterium sp.]|uniref:Histidine phosphatase family protein n=1 Tax=Chloracidobacterium validum TaxID=2821543 RepID=A0ABX8BB04_9BACT|nr:histidine phosphatase family protein [Chloracidobacterium validum]QUW03587.1 histidine phosphatase family protein [Chloracidobacterium validum]